MENKSILKHSTWLPSFAGRHGRNVDHNYLKLVDKHAFSLKEFELMTDLKQNVVLEIGFGSGDVILDQALKSSNTLFIGCEVYLKGVAKLVQNIEKFNINNIRIFFGDGRNALSLLPNQILNTIFLLFPDPWPKRRHQKRRIVTYDFLDLCIKKLRVGGKLIIATDHDDYFNSIEKQVQHCVNFSCSIYENLEKLLLNSTKYQKKSNKIVGYFELIKNDDLY